MEKELEKVYGLLNKRLEKLEKAVFGKEKKVNQKKSDKYEGLVGGLGLLLDNGFFKKPVLVTEVNEELRREGYFHSIQAVDTVMRRDLVKRKKTLNRVQIDGVWQYVIRK